MSSLRLLLAAALWASTMQAVAQNAAASFTDVTPTNFDSGGAVSRQFHLHAPSYLPMTTIGRESQPSRLASKPNQRLANHSVSYQGVQSRFAEYVQNDALLDGVVVLHRGRIAFEAYPHMEPWQRHFAWSVSKVLASTALAVLDERGQADMQAPIARYLPALAESAWANIALEDVANMASGIDCLDSDGYQDHSTCIYTLEESLGITAPTGRSPNFIQHLQNMRAHRKPGEKNEYVSANTQVLMLVIEALTGLSYAQALQQLIWNPIGAEADALLAISPAGHAYASGGLNARLRDVARFGQIYAQPRAHKVLSDNRVAAIATAGVALTPAKLQELRDKDPSLEEDLPVRAGWQWDLIWSDGALYKSGYLGQGLYVDPARELVIAWFGTGLDYDAEVTGMLPVSRQLARGLFKPR